MDLKNKKNDIILILDTIRLRPAWERRASTCGRELLPHADKHVFVYVLELCKSEAKRPLPRRHAWPRKQRQCVFDRCFLPPAHAGRLHAGLSLREWIVCYVCPCYPCNRPYVTSVSPIIYLIKLQLLSK
jgi:hypothetical protein